MRIGYDPDKNARNVAERGLSFDDVPALNWATAFIEQDDRHSHGEVRMRAALLGPDRKPYVVIYTMRGETSWIISFRRAHAKEWRRYAQN